VRHSKRDGVRQIVSLIGGKLTTYRHTAEDLVDAIVGETGWKVKPCETASASLPGGGMGDLAGYILQEETQMRGLPAATLHHLIGFYGTDYKKVLSLTEINPQWLEPICIHAPDIKAQIVYAIRNEWAQSLTDILLRRTSAGTSECQAMDVLVPVGQIAAAELRWTAQRTQEEIEKYKEYVSRFLLAHKMEF